MPEFFRDDYELSFEQFNYDDLKDKLLKTQNQNKGGGRGGVPVDLAEKLPRTTWSSLSMEPCSLRGRSAVGGWFSWAAARS